MSSCKIKINAKAYLDIEEITDWYNKQVPNLGLKFQKNLRLQINTLKYNAYSYGVRYDDIRCMLVKKFPFLIHYSIDEVNQIIDIYAIIHTSRSPKIWSQKITRM
jgi:mRNA-degrading endonuclease RelE of RelBE toxin-antitoxin system